MERAQNWGISNAGEGICKEWQLHFLVFNRRNIRGYFLCLCKAEFPPTRRSEVRRKEAGRRGEDRLRLMVNDKLISRIIKWPKGLTQTRYLAIDAMFALNSPSAEGCTFTYLLPDHASDSLDLENPSGDSQSGRVNSSFFLSSLLLSVLSYVDCTAQLPNSFQSRYACHLSRYICPMTNVYIFWECACTKQITTVWEAHEIQYLRVSTHER